eukprot:5889445-Pyramimonas_sp.AAC.1
MLDKVGYSAGVEVDVVGLVYYNPNINAYTVIVNTFKRPDLLKRSIRHYASCPNVDTIRVVWSDQDNAPPTANDSDAQFFSPCVEVVYDQHPSTSLNNRFKPIDGLRTEAVFNVDDDVNVDCSSLDFAHQVGNIDITPNTHKQA